METKILIAAITLEELLQQNWIYLMGNSAQRYTKIPIDVSSGKQSNLLLYAKNHIPMANVVAPKKTWLHGMLATKFDSIVTIN